MEKVQAVSIFLYLYRSVSMSLCLIVCIGSMFMTQYDNPYLSASFLSWKVSQLHPVASVLALVLPNSVLPEVDDAHAFSEADLKKSL